MLEVRQAYCSTQLDWQAVRQLTQRHVSESSVRLLRQHAADRFGPTLTAATEDGGRAQEDEVERGPGGRGPGPGGSQPRPPWSSR